MQVLRRMGKEELVTTVKSKKLQYLGRILCGTSTDMTFFDVSYKEKQMAKDRLEEEHCGQTTSEHGLTKALQNYSEPNHQQNSYNNDDRHIQNGSAH